MFERHFVVSQLSNYLCCWDKESLRSVPFRQRGWGSRRSATNRLLFSYLMFYRRSYISKLMYWWKLLVKSLASLILLAMFFEDNVNSRIQSLRSARLYVEVFLTLVSTSSSHASISSKKFIRLLFAVLLHSKATNFLSFLLVVYISDC